MYMVETVAPSDRSPTGIGRGLPATRQYLTGHSLPPALGLPPSPSVKTAVPSGLPHVLLFYSPLPFANTQAMLPSYASGGLRSLLLHILLMRLHESEDHHFNSLVLRSLFSPLIIVISRPPFLSILLLSLQKSHFTDQGALHCEEHIAGGYVSH